MKAAGTACLPACTHTHRQPGAGASISKPADRGATPTVLPPSHVRYPFLSSSVMESGVVPVTSSAFWAYTVPAPWTGRQKGK